MKPDNLVNNNNERWYFIRTIQTTPKKLSLLFRDLKLDGNCILSDHYMKIHVIAEGAKAPSDIRILLRNQLNGSSSSIESGTSINASVGDGSEGFDLFPFRGFALGKFLFFNDHFRCINRLSFAVFVASCLDVSGNGNFESLVKVFFGKFCLSSEADA